MKRDIDIFGEARELADIYMKNRKFVSDMERIRPSLLSWLEIDTEGYLPPDYHLAERKMLPKDRRIAAEYIERRRGKEIVDIAICERLDGRLRDVASDSIREGMKGEGGMAKHGISRATLTRIRRKSIEAISDEMVFQDYKGVSSKYYWNDEKSE